VSSARGHKACRSHAKQGLTEGLDHFRRICQQALALVGWGLRGMTQLTVQTVHEKQNRQPGGKNCWDYGLCPLCGSRERWDW